MNVFRQVAESECGRVVLEENLPRLVVVPVVFPISKRRGKGGIRWAMEEDVSPSVFNVWTAEFAMRWRVGVKAAPVFTRGGVVCEGAGHTAGGLNVIGRERQEEAFGRLIADVGFKQPTFPLDGDPPASFVRLGLREDAPVSAHVPFELSKKVRAEDFYWNRRT